MSLPQKVNSQECDFLVEAHGMFQCSLAVVLCAGNCVQQRVGVVQGDHQTSKTSHKDGGTRSEINVTPGLVPGPTTLFSFDIRSHLWKHRD